MPYGSYVNKVRERTCPYYGIKRPLDWFIKDSEACWKCRAVKRDVKEGMHYDLMDAAQGFCSRIHGLIRR